MAFQNFQYEQSSGRVSSLDRAGLLDTYNMFALPETAPHYYLYESMRLLALEEKKPDFNTFTMLEKGSAWTRSNNRPHLQSSGRRQNSPQT